MGQWLSSGWTSQEEHDLPALLCLATGNPPYVVMRVEPGRETMKLQAILQNSGIDQRYFSFPDPLVDFKDRILMPKDKDSSEPPLIERRNEIYVDVATELVARVCGEALEKWGGDPKDITHLVNVTCTGMTAPGIEFLMIEKLGLSKTVQRYGINFMGCFGGTRALSIATSLANESDNSRILFWCIELCTLQYQPFPEDKDWTKFIGSVVFADGCAAGIMGKKLRSHEKGYWYVKNTGSTMLENTPDDMTYTPTHTGYQMTLSRTVPSSISTALISFLSTVLCKDDLEPSDNPEEIVAQLREFEFMIHPGGRLILDKVQANLFLKEGKLNASYEVLRKYGNMSSATILFVLDMFRKMHPEWMQKKAIALAFGPGLAVDGILFYPCRN